MRHVDLLSLLNILGHSHFFSTTAALPMEQLLPSSTLSRRIQAEVNHLFPSHVPLPYLRIFNSHSSILSAPVPYLRRPTPNPQSTCGPPTSTPKPMLPTSLPIQTHGANKNTSFRAKVSAPAPAARAFPAPSCAIIWTTFFSPPSSTVGTRERA